MPRKGPRVALLGIGAERSILRMEGRSRRSSAGGLAGLLAVGLLLSGCPGGPAMLTPYRGPDLETPATGRGEAGRIQELEIRALLLLLADRRQYEGFTVERAFDSPHEETRAELARVLGTVASPTGLDTLKALLLDASPEVRRRAAFSLGVLGDAGAAPNLLAATVDADRTTGRLAVEASAKLGTPVLAVGERMAELGQEEFWARFLPGLFRFEDEAAYPLARLALQQVTDPELRAAAVYALAHRPVPAVAGDLRRLVEDRDPRIRAWAAQGLGRVGAAEDLELMLPLLSDEDPTAVIRTLEAGRRLVAEGFAAPAVEWRRPLRGLVEDPRPGVRLAALATAARWLLDEELEGPILDLARGGEPAFRAAALEALARARHPRAAELAAEAAVDSDPSVRAAAARAADLLDAPEILEALAADGEPRVRLEVLRSWLTAVQPASPEGAGAELALAVVQEALTEDDPAIRATVFDWLTRHPVLPARELAAAVAEGTAGRSTLDVVEPYLAGIRALEARAAYLAAAPDEAGRVGPETLQRRDDLAVARTALKALATSPAWLVRRQAAVALARLGEAPPLVGPEGTAKPAATYEDILLRTRDRPRLRLITERGPLVLELGCGEAPLSCLSFLQLAQQGFYDGTVFHGLEPGRLLSGGDPRGDGWGGPGYTLRDELSPRPYQRGSVGLIRSAADTAGSQFFITLSPQPSLAGHYTHLGSVAEGAAEGETLSLLRPGDRLLSVEVLP